MKTKRCWVYTLQMSKFFILMYILCLPINRPKAQSVDDYIDLELQADLQYEDFDEIDNLQLIEERAQRQRFILKDIPEKIIPPVSPKPFLAALKKGSLLEIFVQEKDQPETNQERAQTEGKKDSYKFFRTKKVIFVWAVQEFYGGPFSLIFNKPPEKLDLYLPQIQTQTNLVAKEPKTLADIAREEGIEKKHQEKKTVTLANNNKIINEKNDQVEPLYRFKTLSRNLVDISRDLKLYPQFDPNINYLPQVKKDIFNTEFKFNVGVFYSYEFLNVPYFQEIHQYVSKTAEGGRLDLKVFYDSNFPIDIGLLMGEQSGIYYINDYNEILSWNSFFMGAMLKYNILSSKEIDLNFQAGMDYILAFNAFSPSAEYIFGGNSWQLLLELVLKTVLGQVTVGIDYKRTLLTIETKTDSNLSLSAVDRSITGLGIFFGLQYGFSL